MQLDIVRVLSMLEKYPCVYRNILATDSSVNSWN